MINIEGRLAEIKTLTLEKIGQRKPLLKSGPLRTTDNILHEMINQYAWHRSALNIWPLNVRLAARIKAACKRKQQLPTLLRQQCWKLLRAGWQWCAEGCNNSQQCCDLQCIVGRIQPISLCKPCVMSVGPNNVGRAVQTNPTLLRYASAITEQKKCWEMLAEKFDWFQTLRNNMQRGVQTDATCNIQQSWELLANNVASFCTGLKIYTVRVNNLLARKKR